MEKSPMVWYDSILDRSIPMKMLPDKVPEIFTNGHFAALAKKWQ